MKKIKKFIKSNDILFKILMPIVTMLRYGKAYLCYVIFVINKLMLKLKIKKADSTISSMKNRYQGEKRRVFVVATGPSLTMEDLNKLELNNEISISMNGIFRVFQNTTWRPTYYILGDPGAFEKLEFRQCHFEECAKREVLLSNLCRKKLCYATNREKIGFFNYNILDHGVARYGSKWYKYSNEFDSGIYDFYTVTNCAIMLADYLGIRDIYLLGVDCNYTGPKAHVGQEEHNITEDELKNALFNQNNMIQSYKKINEILKNKKIRIYNSTRGGSLEVFPRVNFDDLF